MALKFDKTKVYNDLHKDFENAKSSKVRIDKLISDWNDLYYGIRKDKPDSKLLVKEVAKVIEMQKPNITEPFLSTTAPAKITRLGSYGHKEYIESWLNSAFVGDFEREDFINDLVDITLREGTCWIRTSWDYKERKVKQSGVFGIEELLAKDIKPESITQRDDGLFDVTYVANIKERNCPTARVCRNENCFPDNTARTMDELKFFIEKSYVTYYDIVKMGIFSPAQLLELKSKIQSSSTNSYSANKGVLEATRDADELSYGVDMNKSSDSLGRKKIQLMEYWGYYDLHNDGKVLPIVAYWIEDFNYLIDVLDNPYPSTRIPYDKVNYSRRASTLWGNSVAFFLGENQNVKNGITKGILDNLALANNGQKFIQRGALDFTEFVKLKNKQRYIMVNRPDGITDGSYNQIPSSIFNVLQMVSGETEQMTGIAAQAPALTQENINKGGGTGLTMSQQKMASLVRSISGLLSRMFREWLSMAEVFLDDEQILELFTDDMNGEQEIENTPEGMMEQKNKFYDVNIFKNSSKSKVSVIVGTDVARMQKLQQLNMLMQQTKAMGENQVPPESIRALVAQMYDLFDMHDEANSLRTFVPKPTQQEQMQQQMQMQMMQLELAKLQAEVQAINTKAQVDTGKLQVDAMRAQSEGDYRMAQGAEKIAKTENTKVESNLRPAEAMMDMREKIANIQRGDRVNDGTK